MNSVHNRHVEGSVLPSDRVSSAFSSFSMIAEFRVKFPLLNYNLFVNILQISA